MNKYKSHLKIEVEIDPGSSIEDAAKELIALSDELGINIKSKFNGVILIVKPGAKETDLVSKWESAMASKNPIKIAFA